MKSGSEVNVLMSSPVGQSSRGPTRGQSDPVIRLGQCADITEFSSDDE